MTATWRSSGSCSRQRTVSTCRRKTGLPPPVIPPAKRWGRAFRSTQKDPRRPLPRPMRNLSGGRGELYISRYARWYGMRCRSTSVTRPPRSSHTRSEHSLRASRGSCRCGTSHRVTTGGTRQRRVTVRRCHLAFGRAPGATTRPLRSTPTTPHSTIARRSLAAGDLPLPSTVRSAAAEAAMRVPHDEAPSPQCSSDAATGSATSTQSAGCPRSHVPTAPGSDRALGSARYLPPIRTRRPPGPDVKHAAAGSGSPPR